MGATIKNKWGIFRFGIPVVITALLMVMAMPFMVQPARAQDSCASFVHNPDGILAPKQVQQLTQQIKSVQSAGAQAFVSAVKTTNGKAINLALWDELSKCDTLVDSNNNLHGNVIALMVAVEDRKTRVEVGEKLTPFISDATLRNTMNSQFKDGDYEGGLSEGLTYIADRIETGLNEPSTATTTQVQKEVQGSYNDGFTFSMFGWLVAILLVLLVPFLIYKSNDKKRALRARVKELNGKIQAGSRSVIGLLDAYQPISQDGSYFSSILNREETTALRGTISELYAEIGSHQATWAAYAKRVEQGSLDETAVASLEASVKKEFETTQSLEEQIQVTADKLAVIRADLDKLPEQQERYEKTLVEVIDLVEQTQKDGWPVEPAVRLIDKAQGIRSTAKQSEESKRLLQSLQDVTLANDTLEATKAWVNNIASEYKQLQDLSVEQRNKYEELCSTIETTKPLMAQLEERFAPSLWKDVAGCGSESERLVEAVPALLEEADKALDKATLQWDVAIETLEQVKQKTSSAALQLANIASRSQDALAAEENLEKLFSDLKQRGTDMIVYMHSETYEIVDAIEEQAKQAMNQLEVLESERGREKPDVIAVETQAKLLLTHIEWLDDTAHGQVKESRENGQANKIAWDKAKVSIDSLKNLMASNSYTVPVPMPHNVEILERDFETIGKEAITPTEGIRNVVDRYTEIDNRARQLTTILMDSFKYRSENYGAYGGRRSSSDDLLTGIILGSVLNSGRRSSYSGGYGGGIYDSHDEDLFGGGSGTSFGGGLFGGGGMSFGGGGASFGGGLFGGGSFGGGGGSTSSW